MSAEKKGKKDLIVFEHTGKKIMERKNLKFIGSAKKIPLGQSLEERTKEYVLIDASK